MKYNTPKYFFSLCHVDKMHTETQTFFALLLWLFISLIKNNQEVSFYLFSVAVFKINTYFVNWMDFLVALYFIVTSVLL